MKIQKKTRKITKMFKSVFNPSKRSVWCAKEYNQIKTRGSVAAVDERDCRFLKLEKTQERSSVKTEPTMTKVIQRWPEAKDSQSPFSCPANVYGFLLLSQAATRITIKKPKKTFSMLCHPEKGVREGILKFIFQAIWIIFDEDAKNVFDVFGN